MFYAPEMFADSTDGNLNIRGERTDIWALGVTLFFMLTGSYPFESAKSVIELRDLILSQAIDFERVKSPQA